METMWSWLQANSSLCQRIGGIRYNKPQFQKGKEVKEIMSEKIRKRLRCFLLHFLKSLFFLAAESRSSILGRNTVQLKWRETST